MTESPLQIGDSPLIVDIIGKGFTENKVVSEFRHSLASVTVYKIFTVPPEIPVTNPDVAFTVAIPVFILLHPLRVKDERSVVLFKVLVSVTHIALLPVLNETIGNGLIVIFPEKLLFISYPLGLVTLT